MTLYHVQKVEYGHRQTLTGAQAFADAFGNMNAIAENMEAAGWLKTDKYLDRKLSGKNMIMLAQGSRTVILAVVASANTNGDENMQAEYAARSVDVQPIEMVSDYAVTDATPTDDLFADYRDGVDTLGNEGAGV